MLSLTSALLFLAGFVYTLVCADSQYTEVSFELCAPFGLYFDHFALARGEPRLFVTDFHRILQIDLDPASFPTPGVRPRIFPE